MTKRLITWQQIEEAVDKICEQMTDQWLATDQPQCVVGLPRGGMVLAVLLSHRLGIPLEPANKIPSIYNNDQVLIVDDICDSGETLKKWVDEGYKTVCMHWKLNALDMIPDIYVDRAYPNEWIVYPWENPDAAAVADYKMEKELVNRLVELSAAEAEEASKLPGFYQKRPPVSGRVEFDVVVKYQDILSFAVSNCNMLTTALSTEEIRNIENNTLYEEVHKWIATNWPEYNIDMTSDIKVCRAPIIGCDLHYRVALKLIKKQQ